MTGAAALRETPAAGLLARLSLGFGFEAAESWGERATYHVLELFLLQYAVRWAWDWAAVIGTLTRIVEPRGLARDIDLGGLVGGASALVIAALISACALALACGRSRAVAASSLVVLLHVQYVLRHSLGKVTHGSQFVGVGLVMLAVSALAMPSSRSRRRLALVGTRLFIGAGYVCAGLMKLASTGPSWVDGRHLALWISETGIDWLSRAGHIELNALQRSCLDHPALATALLGLGLFAELSGFLLWFRATRAGAAVALIGLHLGIWATLGIRFDSFIGLLVIIGLPLPWFFDRLHARWHRAGSRNV